MNKWALFLMLVALFFTSAFSQSRPASSAADNLEATMKSIQDTVNAIGPVSYVAHGHDSRTGQDWTNKFKDEASEAQANPSICRMRYRWFTSGDDHVNMDKMVGFAFKDVERISVLPRKKIFDSDNAAMGHASWIVTVEPPVFVVLLQRPGNVENHFGLLDEAAANRLAKMLSHAVALCGGNLNQ